MKRLIFACALFAFILSGCDAWTVQPLPYMTSTPGPSSTPIILSATPIILPLPITATIDITPAAPTNTSTPDTSTPTGTATQVVTQTMPIAPTTSVPLTFTPTFTSTPFRAVNTKILGCDTSFDIIHGFGQVTNAFITIQNIGNMDLTDACATLNALDEGRPHPDKTQCVASLPAGYQVREKLTVDTTLGVNSPVQVDVNEGNTLLERLGQNSCADLRLFPSRNRGLGTVTPIQTP